MKKDTHTKAAVSRNAAKTAPDSGGKRSTGRNSSISSEQIRYDAPSTVQATLSMRYIDSRLKQFCLR
jgi:hypothetical protein